MPFYDRTNMPEKVQDQAGIRFFASGRSLSLMRMELEPGGLVPRHTHPHEQVGVVLEGELELVIADERRHLKPGDMYIIPGNVPHEARGLEAKAVFFDAWTPPRMALPGEDAVPGR